ncbi:MAG: PEGA domain-containing protein [Candidatus Cryosericum sp.]|nr:PEGA domain-containing protein [bacterium]
MSEPHSNEPDRIDELLGSLQESRTAQHASEALKPSPPPHSHRNRVWIVIVVALGIIAAAAFLYLRGREASLNIRSFPSGARVLLDEREVGTTPLVLERVPPGSHTIELQLSGWEVWKGTTTAVKGKTTQVIANMTHAAYTMVVTSTPSGATVTIDGIARGTTPLTITGLKPRNYKVIVSLKGYADITRSVDLSDQAQTTQHFSLLKSYGELNITSDPAGAQVLLDGKAYGTTPLKLDSFPVGTYALTLKLDGSPDITDTISVAAGTVLSKQYKFTTLAGGLSISTDPAGASITIDGQPTNQISPFTFTGLKEGVHEVLLELPGYLPWSGEATVSHDQTGRLSIALTKLQQ